MIEFQRIKNTQTVVDYILECVQNSARDKKVLLLVPGGSALPIARTVLANIPQETRKNIAVTLTDERYGDIGHADENWTELVKDIELSGYAHTVAVNAGKNFATTVADFSDNLEMLLEWSDVVIGLFGMGADGHTAGMLPHSSATRTTKAADGYQAGPFMRITTTAHVLSRIDTAVLYAVGEEKQPMLDALSQEISYEDVPAQLLKKAKKLIVFNDYKGAYAL